MLELHPFTGHVVAADRARRVVAPPYDALDPAARAALAAADPDSYLGALPPGSAHDAADLDAALARCRAHLDRLFAAGRYRELPGPTIGVLAFGAGPTRSTAIVGDVPVTAFAALTERGAGNSGTPFTDDDGRIRPHERVREQRVADLTRYLELVGVASSPVALTQRPADEVTVATAAATARPPDVAYRADDGVDVALWCVTDPQLCTALTAAVTGAGPAFLADGHHRGAAAGRYAADHGAGSDQPAGRVLCAVLPSDHLTVEPFHRRFDDVLPPTARDADAHLAGLLARLRDAGVVATSADDAAAPTGPHEVTMTAAGRWWHLDVAGLVRHDDPVEALDVRLVDRELAPLLATDAPVAAAVPVPAPLGFAALVAPGAVGVALYPPDVETVFAIASAGRSLPPKTTYVMPKLRSGLVVTPRTRSAAPRRA